MTFFSRLKSTLLAGADAFNAAVGGPSPFLRAAVPDPAAPFTDEASRRAALTAAAEAELAAFVAGGVFFCARPNDLGDTAIWQGVYTAATVLRWMTAPSPEAHAAMLAAAQALARFFYPTGPSAAILVRGAVPAALERSFFHVDPNNGAHYFTDGYLGVPYVYRDDASLDSLLGVMFGAAIVQRFGDASARAAMAPALALFARGFKAAGYRLTRRDGAPTTYGDCRPGFLQAPVRLLAAALPSLLAGTDDWRAIAKAYAPEFATTDTQIPGRISYVNAHLAMLANLTYVFGVQANAPGPAGSAPGLVEAADGLRRLVGKYADAGNAFLVYACAAVGLPLSQGDKDKASKILLEFPLGPKPKRGLNSSTAPALQPVPVWQRPPADIFWQRSPYPYSGSETTDYTRLDYLLAHYLQRSA